MLKNVLVTSLVCFSLGSGLLDAADCTAGTPTSCRAIVSDATYDSASDFGNKCLRTRGSDDWRVDLTLDLSSTFTSYNYQGSSGGGTGYPNGVLIATNSSDPCINSNADVISAWIIDGNSSQKTFQVLAIGCDAGEDCFYRGSIVIKRKSSGTTYGVMDIKCNGYFPNDTADNKGNIYLGESSVPGNVIVRTSLPFSKDSSVQRTVYMDIPGSSLTGAGTVTLSNPYRITGSDSAGSVALNAAIGTKTTFTSSDFIAEASSSNYLGINYSRSVDSTSFIDDLTGLELTGTIAFATNAPTLCNTKIFAGTLQFQVAPLGSGIIQINDSGNLDFKFASPTTVDDNFTFFCGITDTGLGTITVSSAETTLAGEISGGTLEKMGTGILTLPRAAYAMPIAINEGTLQFKPAVSGEVSLSGLVTGSGNLLLTAPSGGSLTLRLDNILEGSFAGTATIQTDTTLWYDDDGSALGPSANIVITGGTFNLDDNSSTIASLSGSGGFITLGSAILTIGGTSSSNSTISGTGGIVATGSLDLTGSTNSYTGMTTVGSGATLTIEGSGNIGSGSINLGGILEVTADTTLTQDILLNPGANFAVALGETLTLSGGVSGSNGFILSSGNLLLSNTNSYTGVTEIANGATLSITSAGSLGTDYGSTIINGTLEITPIASGIITLLEPFSGSGVLALNTPPSGTLVLELTNATSSSFTGTVTIPTDTTLLYNVESALGPSVNVSITGGTFDLGGNNSTVASLSAVGGFVNLGSGYLIIGGDSSSTATISGTGGLTITGSGTALYLTGSTNSYTGTTTVDSGAALIIDSLANIGYGSLSLGGTLQVFGDITLPSSQPIVVSSGADFLVTAGRTLTVSSVISGSSGFTVSGGGTLLLEAINIYTGNTTVSDSVLQVSTDTNLGVGSSIILNQGTLQVVASASIFTSTKGFQNLTDSTVDVGDNTVVFTGNLTGLSTGSLLTKVGSGSFSLLSSSSSSSLANLVISEGDFIGNAYSLGSTIITTSDDTEIVFYQTVSSVFSGTVSGAGAFRMTGTEASTLTVANPQNFMGGLLLEGGKYSVSSDAALGGLGGGIYGIGQLGVLQTTVSFPTTRNVTFIDQAITFEVLNLVTLTFDAPSVMQGDTLIKTGTGSLVSNGDVFVNTYDIVDGTVTINGTLQASTLASPMSSATISSSSIESSFKASSLSFIADPSHVSVAQGAFLFGGGLIDGFVDVSGGICGGNSTDEGVLTITKDVTMESSSLFAVRMNSTTCSSLHIEGELVINSGVNALLVPARGLYTATETLVLVEAAGGVVGQFARASAPPVFFMAVQLDYSNPLDITATVTPIEIFPEVHGANADAVANALDKVINWNRENVVLDIPLVDTVSNALLPEVLTSLLPLVDFPNKMTNALNQMHPAPLKGMVIAGENASIEVREAISYRMQNELDIQDCYVKEGSDCLKSDRLLHFWISGMGNVLTQNSNTYNHSPQVGYQSKLVGFASGADVHFANYFYAGLAGGYTSSHVEWKQNHGHGDVNTGHGGVYLSFLGEMFYGNLSVLGGWSGYNTTRHINYPGVHETGKSSHGGRELLSHIDTGINLSYGGFTVRPFDSFDYIAGKESSYREEGAGEWNLRIHKSNSILLRNELGLQFAACLCIKNSKWTLSPKASWIREVRVKGSHYKAEFASASAFPFTVTGYFPSRNLFSPGVMLSGILLEDKLALNFTYNGEFTGGYSAHRYAAEARFGF